MRKISPTFIAAAVVVTLSVFILLSMLFYGPSDYLERGARAGSDSYYGLRFSVASLFFGNLGIGAYVGWMIVLAWAVIVFFRESVGELAIRGVSLCVSVFSAAALAELLGSGNMGGAVGYAIGDVLQASFGSTLGVILMGAILLVSLVLATDFGFVSYYREAREALAVIDRDEPPADDEPDDLVSRIEKTAREEEEEAEVCAEPPAPSGDGLTEPIVLNLRPRIQEESLDEELMTADEDAPAEAEAEEPVAEDVPEDDRFEAVALPPRRLTVPARVEADPEIRADDETAVAEGETDDRFEAVAMPPAKPADDEIEAEAEAPPDTAPRVEVATDARIEEAVEEETEEEIESDLGETEDEAPTAETTPVEEEAETEAEVEVEEEFQAEVELAQKTPEPEVFEDSDVVLEEEEREEPVAMDQPEATVQPGASEEEELDDENDDEDDDDEPRPVLRRAPRLEIETEPMEDDLEERAAPAASPSFGRSGSALASVFDALLGPADDPLTAADEREVEAFLMRQTRVQPRPAAVEDPEMEIPARLMEIDDSIPGAEEPEPVVEPDAGPEPKPEATADVEDEPVAEVPPGMSYAVLDQVILVDDEISIDAAVGDGTDIDEQVMTSPEPVRDEPAPAEDAGGSTPAEAEVASESPRAEPAEVPADSAEPDGARPPFMEDGDDLPVLEDLTTPDKKGVFRSLFKRRREPAVVNSSADTLLDEAAKLVIERGRASVVLLQRRLDIGYTRATRLIDTLEDHGLVGPMTETGSREVLLTREGWQNLTRA